MNINNESDKIINRGEKQHVIKKQTLQDYGYSNSSNKFIWETSKHCKCISRS